MRVKGQQGGGENYIDGKKGKKRENKISLRGGGGLKADEAMRVRRRGRRAIHLTRVESVGVERKGRLQDRARRFRAYIQQRIKDGTKEKERREKRKKEKNKKKLSITNKTSSDWYRQSQCSCAFFERCARYDTLGMHRVASS